MKKEELTTNHNKNQDGFGTLEMLIAFFVLIMTITAITSLSFGGQAIAVDTETNAEALYRAQGELENFRALSRQNFLGVNTTGYDDGFYTGTTTVTDISQCLKKAVTRLNWDVEGRPQFVELSTILSDWNVVFEIGDTCSADDIDNNNWTYPSSFGDIKISSVQGEDIDVINGIIHLATKSPSPSKDDLYIVWPPYNDPDDGTPDQIGIDLDSEGANALDVAYYPDLGKYYAFVAGDYNEINNSNYKKAEQLKVVDVTDYKNLATSSIVASDYLPDVKGKCNYTCPGGRSIYYHDNKVYMGTHYLGPGTGLHEFHIFDVTDPTKPNHLGSTKIWHNVNSIFVRGDYAYLAVSSTLVSSELIVLNINPSSSDYLDVVGSFNAPGAEDGTSVYVLGNKIFLGREKGSASHPEFYVIDADTLEELGHKYLALNNSSALVSGIRASGNLVFLSSSDTTDEFMALDISDLNNIEIISNMDCFTGFLPNYATGIDFEDNLIYESFRSNEQVRIIQPGIVCPS